MMTGTQRIRALLEGGPIDRTPIGGWYHMPLVDRNVTDFTRELIASTDLNRWDFIKIMTNGHFYTEAYGGEIDFSRTYNRWNGTAGAANCAESEGALWRQPAYCGYHIQSADCCSGVRRMP